MIDFPRIPIIFLLFVSAYILWGLIPYFETSYREEVGPLTTVFIRFSGSTILLLCLLVLHRVIRRRFWQEVGGLKKFSFEKIPFKVWTRQVEVPRIIVYISLGALFIIALNFYFLMLRTFHNTLAIGITLSLGFPPVLIAIFEIVFGKFRKQRVPQVWRFIIGLDAAIAGIGAAICSLQHVEGEWSISSGWLSYAVIAGFVISWSAWLLLLSRDAGASQNRVVESKFIVRVWKIAIIFASGSITNFLVLILFFKPEIPDLQKCLFSIFKLNSASAHLSFEALTSLIMMVLVSTFFSYILYFTAFSQSLDSNETSVLASILQTVEPLTAVVISVLVWHESLTNLAILGIVLVLASMLTILIVTWRLGEMKERTRARSQQEWN